MLSWILEGMSSLQLITDEQLGSARSSVTGAKDAGSAAGRGDHRVVFLAESLQIAHKDALLF